MINDQPGPELDAKVSRCLFGITPPIPTLPEYSTTWEGMQLVVEEMQRREKHFTLSYRTDGEAYARFGMVAGRFGVHPPHATALAAIAALEGQVDV